jgi:addiction module RelB/DinJ family antitoxin
MSTISVRIDEEKKKLFHKATQEIGLDASTALRVFIEKFIENNRSIKIDIDNDIMNEVMQIGENSFSEVWENSQDDIYAKLYKNV